MIANHIVIFPDDEIDACVDEAVSDENGVAEEGVQ